MKERVKVPVEDPKDNKEKSSKEKKVEEEKEPDLVWITLDCDYEIYVFIKYPNVVSG